MDKPPGSVHQVGAPPPLCSGATVSGELIFVVHGDREVLDRTPWDRPAAAGGWGDEDGG